MLNTLGIVEVRRVSGSQLEIGRKLGGKSILEGIVRRATECERLDAVVVLCPEADLAEVRQLVPSDVEVLAAVHGDPLAATLDVCTRLGAKSLVHISADNPFVDPELVDRLVSASVAHPNCDYIGYCRANGEPAILTQLGVLAEWCSVSALKRVARQGKVDHGSFTSYLYAHPKKFNVRLLPLPAELDREDLRLRIDSEEDWEHAHVIYEALGHDEWDWRHVADLLHSQPALRNRMADLNRLKQPA